jgi:hypothetical protein
MAYFFAVARNHDEENFALGSPLWLAILHKIPS